MGLRTNRRNLFSARQFPVIATIRKEFVTAVKSGWSQIYQPLRRLVRMQCINEGWIRLIEIGYRNGGTNTFKPEIFLWVYTFLIERHCAARLLPHAFTVLGLPPQHQTEENTLASDPCYCLAEDLSYPWVVNVEFASATYTRSFPVDFPVRNLKLLPTCCI